jgi:hypothetical protein
VVVPDFNVVDRKEEVDTNALELKQEIEHAGRIRFRYLFVHCQEMIIYSMLKISARRGWFPFLTAEESPSGFARCIRSQSFKISEIKFRIKRQ